jgi:hypothetical protein
MIFITTAPLGRDPGCVASSRESNGRHRADKKLIAGAIGSTSPP